MAGFSISKGLPGFGASFGEGLGSGLEALAQHKLGQVLERQQQRSEAKNFESAGFTPQESQFLASQPAQLRPNYIRQLRPGGFSGQQYQTQQLQEQAITPQEQQAVGLEAINSAINPRSQANPAQRQLEKVTGAQGNGYLKGLFGGQDQSLMQQPELGRQLTPEKQPMRPQAPGVNATHVSQKEQRRRPSVAEALTAPVPDEQVQASAIKEQESINKDARKAIAEFSDKGKVARDIEKKLPKLEKLITSGKLSSPTLAGILGAPKKLGIDLTSWLSPETGELIGSENIFYPLMKYVIGGNPTDAKLKAFSDKLPKATDSDDVKMRKVENLKILVKDLVAEEKAANKIAKQFGGQLPQNFRELVYEEAGRKEPQEESVALDFAELPDPSSYKGSGFTDEETGRTAKVVNGQWKWVS